MPAKHCGLNKFVFVTLKLKIYDYFLTIIGIGNDSPRLRSIAFDPIVRGELGYLRVCLILSKVRCSLLAYLNRKGEAVGNNVGRVKVCPNFENQASYHFDLILPPPYPIHL